MDKQKNDSGPYKLGELISSIRKQKQMTYRDLEEATGITSAYINRLEKGNRDNPTYLIIHKIAKALGVHEQIFLQAIVNEAEPMETKEMQTNNIQTLSELMTNTIMTSTFSIRDIEASLEVKNSLINLISKIDKFNIDSSRQKDTEFLEAFDDLSNAMKRSQGDVTT